ncbi:MAG: bifunctional (p)ppGpp synthetase/guanosine-3',5'-bis(diphosphate) 3'-pyrophosphohydrolase [Rikenellaceae bacterium]|nr:bifunctional (p)ppGpp synthetase/guanosine-3',5'-bis(diphosphate) 3'-pyrophosphohydrolase [Rikenellaceae bacterium]
MNIAIDDAVVYLCKALKIRTGIELYNRILNEKIDFAQIKEIIGRHLSGEADEQRRTTAAAIDAAKLDATKVYNTRPSGDALVIDDRISKIDYKLAKCCNPIMGDEVFGFVTINAGITIHRSDCPNASRLRENYPYRIMEARWREQVQGGASRASIKIVAEDTTGMVNSITEVVNRDLKLNIRSMNLSSCGGTLSGLINVEVPSANVVDMLIYSILRIRGVQRAYRVNN